MAELRGPIDRALPPPESELASNPAGFSCGACQYARDEGSRCIFPRWATPPPEGGFYVEPAWCCRFFDSAQMRALSRPGTGTNPLRFTARSEKERIAPKRPRERKPTEQHLNRLIAGYKAAYQDLGQAAVRKALKQLGRDPRMVNEKAVRETFLAEVLPILDLLQEYAADAVRLGAARIANPQAQRALIEQQVEAIVPGIVKARRAWLEKMSRDFVQRVVKPELARLAQPGRDAASRAAGFRAAGPDELDVEMTLDPGLYYDEDMLKLLQERGYRFVLARAVEATEHDIWKGDDLGYIGAAHLQGVESFRWRTSEDPLVCPVCDDLDGQEFDAGEAAQMSADRGSATHCRCRCWFEAVESEGEPELQASAARMESWQASLRLALATG